MNAITYKVDRPRRNAKTTSKGLTLFELLLALAIFLTSLAALAQLLDSGARAAAQSQLQTEAILRCESKLGELVSGITPMEEVAGRAFEDDPSWSWRLSLTGGPWPNLQLAELQVSHTGQSSLANSSYTLRRYVRDSSLFVDTAPRRPQIAPIQSVNGAPNRATTRTRQVSPSASDGEDSDG